MRQSKFYITLFLACFVLSPSFQAKAESQGATPVLESKAQSKVEVQSKKPISNARVVHDEKTWLREEANLGPGAALTPRPSAFGYIAFFDDNDVYQSGLYWANLFNKTNVHFRGSEEDRKNYDKNQHHSLFSRYSLAELNREKFDQLYDYLLALLASHSQEAWSIASDDMAIDSVLSSSQFLTNRFGSLRPSSEKMIFSVYNKLNIYEQGYPMNIKNYFAYQKKGSSGMMISALIGSSPYPSTLFDANYFERLRSQEETLLMIRGFSYNYPVIMP
jgi:hypothetical protein